MKGGGGGRKADGRCPPVAFRETDLLLPGIANHFRERSLAMLRFNSYRIGLLAMPLVVVIGCAKTDVPPASPAEQVAAVQPVRQPTAVLRDVAAIKPWREYRVERWPSQPSLQPANQWNVVARRLPPVAEPVVPIARDTTVAASESADSTPIGTSVPTVDVQIDEVAEDAVDDVANTADDPEFDPPLPEGMVINPFAVSDREDDASEPDESVLPVDDITPAVDGRVAAADVPPPPVPVVTDAVVPAHLQESWFGLIRGAYALGNRGAQYAARQEFERTLYEIAQTKDVLSGGQHTAALARALRALDEAADFLPGQGNVSAAPRADIILAGHQTPIASQLPTTLPASALMEAYHRYAEAQFGEAVGGVRAGSMALHALGKLYDRLATEDADNCRDAGDRAITLQRAALRAHGGNYLAANELGVLLARGGDHRRARQQFVRSLQLTRTREAEYNLAMVDAKLAQAQGRAAPPVPQSGRLAQAPRRPRVEWVPAEQFAGAKSGRLAGPHPAASQHGLPKQGPPPAVASEQPAPGRLRQALNSFLPPKHNR